MKLKKLLQEAMNPLGGEPHHLGHPHEKDVDDHEVSMAVTDLKSLAHRAAKLAKFIEESGQTELKGWIQSKITKSADYINAVFEEYMFGDEGGSDCGTCGDGSLNEKKGTCCHKCGHVHVKGTAHPTPYFTGEKNCKNR